MKALAYILFIPIGFLLGVFWGGYVTSVLWNWYAAPLGAPVITYAQAAGVHLVVGSTMGLRGLGVGTTQDPEWGSGLTFAAHVFVPGILLLSGWVLHVLFF